LGSLTTNADGTTVLKGGSVKTKAVAGPPAKTGAQIYNDPVTLGADTTLMSTGHGTLTFNSTIDGTFKLKLYSGTAAGDQGKIIFADNVGAGAALNELTAETYGGTILFTSPAATQQVNAAALVELNPAGHAAVPDVATMWRAKYVAGVPSEDKVDLTITLTGAPGDFTMGQNEKMTVMGQLDITAPGTATLGDLTTLGDMKVNMPAAGSIVLRKRAGGAIKNYLGVIEPEDGGLDFVAGGLIHFGPTPTEIGTGSQAEFADKDGIRKDGLIGWALFRQFPETITANKLHFGADVLDLRAQGITADDVSSAIAGATPRPLYVVTSEAGPGAEQRDALKASLQIDVRDLRPDEIALRLLMLGQINDVYLGRGDETRMVARTRIPTAVAQALLDAYNRTFFKDPSQGKEPLAGEIQAAFRKAWDDYKKTAGDPPAEGDARRAYVDKFAGQLVENPQNKATEAAGRLGTIFSLLERVGLSPGEQAITRTNTLRRWNLVPEGMGQADMEQVIEYVSKKTAAEALTARPSVRAADDRR
jgi:hypothetical protein